MQTIFFFFLCLFLQPLVATQLLTGDKKASTGMTFSFPVNVFTQNNSGTVVYVGAAEPGAQEFSIASMNFEKCKFLPWTPAKIAVDGTLDVDNPLYNKAIARIAPLQLKKNGNDEAMVVVTADEPNAMYVHQFLDPNHIITLKEIKDAACNTANGIVAMATTSDGKLFAAVKGHDQLTFGVGDSGIAVFTLYLKSEKEKKDASIDEAKKQTVRWDFMQHNVVPGPITKDEEESKKSRALSLTKESAQIGIKAPVSALSIADMHWDSSLNVLYVAFETQAGADAQDGTRSIVTVQLTADNKIIMSPLAHENVFADNNHNTIVGASGAYACVCAHKVRSMLTTTFLHYLIVQGGVGDAAHTKRMVYALPVVNMRKEDGTLDLSTISLHGSLAKIKKPCTKFRSAKSHLFLGRYFDEPAQNPEDVYTTDSLAARIGGGPLPADIATLMVRDDTVFALINSEHEEEAGIYYSQAVFESNGRIGAWTHWRKTQVHGINFRTAAYEYNKGNFVLLGDNQEQGCAVRKTQWSTTHNLTEQINTHFIDTENEISGLFEFEWHHTPMLAVTGNRTILFTQQTQPNASTVFCDGALADMATITTVAAAECEGVEHLFVGGLHGIAYLADNSPDIVQMGTLHANMHFKKIGDYQCVRKLIIDEQYLYVLTDKYFDRIDIQQSNFAQNILAATRLYSADKEILTDVLVSEKLALLASSKELVRVGNGCDIRAAACHEEVCWTSVPLEGNKFPIMSLHAVTLSGAQKDLARLPYAQIYVLAGYIGKSSTDVYRITVQLGADVAITENTVQMVQDWKNEVHQGAFIRFGDYKELFGTDGTLFLNIRSKKNDQPAVLLNGVGRYQFQLVKDPTVQNAHALLHSITRGSWMIAGNFGLLVNE